MTQLIIFIFVTALISNLFSYKSMASSTETLPEGVHNVSLRYAVISGLDQKFTTDGTLRNLGESRSITFNAETLVQISSQAQSLVAALNKFGSKNLGRDINLGTLLIDTKPDVSYWAPIFAYGITPRWTMGFAIPVVKYKNKIQMHNKPANIGFYQSQLQGLSQELDQALQTDLVLATQETLAARGYDPLNDRNETFVGDIPLFSLLQIKKNEYSTISWQTRLYLPTGPKYNPNDLAALNVFGRTSLENSILYSYTYSKWEFIPSASVLLNLPDEIKARVPKNEDDLLPEQSQIQSVRREISPTFSLEQQANYSIDSTWTISTAINYSTKGKDRYRGTSELRYDLLSQGTESNSFRGLIGISWSTVNSFHEKKSVIPSIASMNISDTLAGSNVERRLITELNLMVFF